MPRSGIVRRAQALLQWLWKSCGADPERNLLGLARHVERYMPDLATELRFIARRGSGLRD
jgi:hypothetical protein